MRVTDCECTGPGWCERHQCEKSLYWYRLCQRKPSFFKAWEAGRGPGQIVGPPSASQPQAPCVSRGEVLREEKCATCARAVRIKVFHCKQHGECTLSPRLSSVRTCRTCSDYIS
jgi:hypothetical protein